MAFKFANRVRETSGTTGTGTLTLAGAFDATFQTFSDGVGDGNTCLYHATDGTWWESGIATIGGGGTTLARTLVMRSNNSNAAVSFAASVDVINAPAVASDGVLS